MQIPAPFLQNNKVSSMNNNLILKILVIFSLLAIGKAVEYQADDVDEFEFSYIRGSYNGPERWGLIKPEWRICNTGKRQSPIDLPNRYITIVEDWQGLQVNYKPAPAVIYNPGFYIEVEWEGDAGGVYLDGKYYNLTSFHWHHPSEHTLNGYRYAMELHAVHSSSDGKKLVIGVLHEYNRPDPFLATYVIPELEHMKHNKTCARTIDPNDINLPNTSYYRYMGSLTTPPCTEGVTWMVSKQVKTVSYSQVRALRMAVAKGYEYNARPLQPRNQREILLYKRGGYGFYDK